ETFARTVEDLRHRDLHRNHRTRRRDHAERAADADPHRAVIAAHHRRERAARERGRRRELTFLAGGARGRRIPLLIARGLIAHGARLGLGEGLHQLAHVIHARLDHYAEIEALALAQGGILCGVQGPPQDVVRLLGMRPRASWFGPPLFFRPVRAPGFRAVFFAAAFSRAALDRAAAAPPQRRRTAAATRDLPAMAFLLDTNSPMCVVDGNRGTGASQNT